MDEGTKQAERAPATTGPPDGKRPDPRARQRVYRRRRLTVVVVALALATATLLGGRQILAGAQDTGEQVRSADPPATTSATNNDPALNTTTPTTTVLPTTTAVPVTAAPPPINVGPLPKGTGAIPVVHRVPTTDPVVFITIDDGVTPEPEALEFLRSRNVPTTLFLTRNYIGLNVSYFQSLHAAGSTIGSHSMNHTDLRDADEAVQQREVCAPSEPFTGWFATAPEVFRPPYGKYDDTTLRVAAGCGIRALVHWTATMEDGVLTTDGQGLLPGDVILLHFKPGLTVNLSVLLDQIASAGLRPAPLVDYIRAAPAA